MKWFFSIIAFAAMLMTFHTYGLIESSEETPDNDTIDGEFQSSGYNNPTEVTDFEFRKANTSSAIVSGASLTPNQEYYVRFEIYDREGFADVTRVAIAFFDNDGYQNSQANTFRGDQEPGVSSNGDEITFAWWRADPLSSAGAIGIPSSNADGATLQNAYNSWEIIQSTAPAVGTHTDHLTEAAFEFVFRMSRVANEATHSWRFGYLIEDGVLNGGNLSIITSTGIQISTSPDTDPDDGVNTFSMDWYGEIEVPSENISWSSISPGMGFDDANAEVKTENFTYYSNGEYKVDVAVTNIWTASAAQVSGVQNAQLTSSSIIDASQPPQTFSLKFDVGSANPETRIEITPTAITNVYSEAVDYNAVLNTATPTATSESGKDEDYYFYLKTSDSLQNATYSGNIKFTIRND